MTNLREISYADSSDLDAFRRLRTSEPLILIEEKNVSAPPIIGNKAEGGATITRQEQKASWLLKTGGVGSKATRQTRQRAVYQPTKSQQISVTFTPGPVTDGIIQRVGYFDDNNGLFFEINGDTDIAMVMRSDTSGSPVDQRWPRSVWSDPLDGSGPSGKTLDLTKSQILSMDFQWLGVGRVRFGFVIDGRFVGVYADNHANLEAGVYMRVPNQPIRWQIESTTSDAVVGLEAICGGVASEGGFEQRGLVIAYDRNGTALTGASAGNYYELVAVRLDDTGKDIAAAFPINATVLCSTTQNFIWEIWLNGGGTTGGTWATPAGSLCESAIDRTMPTAGYTTGVKFASGYVSSRVNTDLADIFGFIGLGYDIATDAADVVSLAIYPLSGTNESFYGGLTLRQEA